MVLEKQKKSIFIGTILLFVLIGTGLFLHWLFYGRFYESTKNAYVGGNKVNITAQVEGIVIKIGTEDTCFVEKGTVLVELDPTDQTIALAQAGEKLANACRSVVNLFEQVKEREADVFAKKALADQALQDYLHRQTLFPSGAVSLEDLQQAEATYAQDIAFLLLAEAQLEAAKAQVAHTTVSTHPQVKEKIEAFKNAYVQLKRCKILAPVSGLIAQKTVQLGQYVKVADSLMDLVPLEEMWIDANFREVQIRKMKIGQPAQIRADVYGSSVEYTGTIVGIGAGTGSVFSLLPPQNATGNWVKIVQRVPVRVCIPKEELLLHPLRLGLSTETTIDLHDQQGVVVPLPIPKADFLYKTDIYENEIEGALPLIEKILEENVPEGYRS